VLNNEALIPFLDPGLDFLYLVGVFLVIPRPGRNATRLAAPLALSVLLVRPVKIFFWFGYIALCALPHTLSIPWEHSNVKYSQDNPSQGDARKQ